MTNREQPSECSESETRDAHAWEEFASEARELLSLDTQDMSVEQFDRFEAISDAFVHLFGYALELQQAVNDAGDQRLLEELKRRESGRIKSRSPVTVLSDDERSALRDRILAGLHAQHLRVREGERAPSERPLEVPRVPSAELLGDLESAHRALLVPELAVAAGAGHELWDIECTTTVDVPAELPRGRYLALQVAGDSMEPLIHSSDVVLVRVGERAEPGSVVVARDPEHGYVIKEVARLTALGIELRSLNPAFPSLRLPHGAGVVLGTVVLRWARPERVRPSSS